MQSRIIALFVLALASLASGEDLYVQAGATGGNTGLDWTNAWNSFTAVKWGTGAGKVGPGDTLWVAGGTYTQRLLIGASGTAGNLISIKRVRTTDAVPTAAAGWSPSFDSRVTIDVSSSTSLILFQNSVGNYVTIDGRVDGGIYLPYKNAGAGVEIDGSGNFNDITVKYIEAAGPGPITQSGDTRGFDFTIAGSITNITVSHCAAHHSDTLMQFTNNTNLVVEYCDIHDAAAVNAATYHPNTIYCGSAKSATFRYNRLYNITVEGLFFGDSGNSGVKIYGNLFYGGVDTGRGIEIDNSGSISGLEIYNNSFVNLPFSPIRMSGLSATGTVSNNIMWNCGGVEWGSLTHDYNFFSGANTEAHGIASGSNPFVNLGGNDFHIIGTVSSKLPRNKGQSLAAEFNVDAGGTVRGADGTWDMGAFEFGSAATPPSAVQNVRIQP